MARRSLPKSTRLANIASKRPKKARRILGKETLKLGTKAFTKMFPQLGALLNSKSTGSSLESNSNESFTQIYNSAFSQILENQNKQNDILNQILQQLKNSNNFSGNNNDGNDSPFIANYKPRRTPTPDAPKPIDATPKPINTPEATPKPVDTTPKPVDTTPKPVDTTPKPINTPEAPERPVAVDVPERPVTPEAPERPVTPEAPERPVAVDVPERPVTPEAATRLAQSPVLSSVPPPIPLEAATRLAQSPVLSSSVPPPIPLEAATRLAQSPVLSSTLPPALSTSTVPPAPTAPIDALKPINVPAAVPERTINASSPANAPEASARTRMSVLSEPNNESRSRIPPTFNAVPPPPTPAATPAPPAAPPDVSRTPIPAGPDASRVPPAGTADGIGDTISKVSAGSGRAAALGLGAGFLAGLATEDKTGQSATSTAIAGASTAAQTVVLSQAAEQTIKRFVRDKTIGIVLRKIPLAGLLAGIWFSGDRAWAGDWVGAGLELTSGVAGTLGGVTFGAGTAASVAIDVGLLTRDIYKILYDKFPEHETDASIRDANMAAIGTSVTKAFNDFISSAPAPQNPALNEGTRGQLARIFRAAQGEDEEAQMLRSLIGEDVMAGIAGLLRQNTDRDGRQSNAAREGMARVLARIRPLVIHGSAPSARMIEIPPPASPVPQSSETLNENTSDGSGDGGEEGGSGSDATLKEETPKTPDATAITLAESPNKSPREETSEIPDATTLKEETPKTPDAIASTPEKPETSDASFKEATPEKPDKLKTPETPETADTPFKEATPEKPDASFKEEATLNTSFKEATPEKSDAVTITPEKSDAVAITPEKSDAVAITPEKSEIPPKEAIPETPDKLKTPETPDAVAITPEKSDTPLKEVTSEIPNKSITPEKLEAIIPKIQNKDKENNNLDVDTINKNSMMFLTLKEFERINFEARLIKFESTGIQSKLTETDTVQNRSSTGGGFAGISNISGSARNIAAGAMGNITTGDGQATNGSAARALEFFQSKGWSLAQAAGIVANLDIETGGTFNPAAIGDGGKAYGIAQWHPDRQAHFQSWAGRSIRGSTFEQQLEFVQFELTEGREKRAGNRIRQTTTPQEAAAITDQFYERSNGTARVRRIRRAITLAGNAAQDATQTNQATNTGGGGSEPPQTATQAPSTGGGNGAALSQASTGAQADTHNHGSSSGGQNSAAPVEPSPSTGADLAQAGTDMIAGDQRQALNPQGMVNNNAPQSPAQQSESSQSNPREQMTSNEIPLRNRLESTFSYRS